MKTFLLGLLLFLHVFSTRGQVELFQNADFEEPFDGTNNWWCNNCQLEKSTDSQQGAQSGRVTARSAYWAGISQYVPVSAGRSYHFSAYLKVLNQQPGAMWHRVDLMLEADYQDGGKVYHWIGRSPYMRQDAGWTLVGGDLIIPERVVTRARFYVQFVDQEINYLMDTASMTEIVANPVWRQEADNRIEVIRKRDIEIRLDADPILDPLQMEIRLEQTRHEFAFGSAVSAGFVSGSDERSRRYQETFYNMFEWAVMENALKWKHMEPARGQVNYVTAEQAIDALRDNGVPVRGHCVVWGVEDHCPDWLKPLGGSEVRQEVTKRIEGVGGRYRGKLVHWDVNNEQLHGDFFENRTGDPWYTEQMFAEMALQDPGTKLFFNEYNIVNHGSYTYAYVQQVTQAVRWGAPVYGLGAQSHMPVEFDIATIMKRLDVAALAGVPIWITEMTVQHEDRTARANGYEDLLRLYFSHPAVEGILLWGFWDGAHYRPTAALVEGEDFQLNEAGLRYMDLVHNTWRTNETLYPLFNQDVMTTRGFFGNYTLTVNYMGVDIATQNFSFSYGASPVIVEVNL